MSTNQGENMTLPTLDLLGQNLRYALRSLRHNPGFSLTAILILALGIGSNIAVFSVVNTILLRPLPFRDPQQLVWIAGNKGVGGLSYVTYTVAVFEEFQRTNKSFQAVTHYMPFLGDSDYKLSGRGEPQQVAGLMVADNFFQTLGVQPALGRLFLPEECRKNGRPAVLLGYYFWQRQFAGDPSILGKAITLNKREVTVVGVLPETFDFGSVFSPGLKMDIYVPGILDDMRNWGNTLSMLGRLKPGVTVAQAQAESTILFSQFNERGYTGTMTELKEYVSGKLRRSLIVLWWAVGMILLIVCVNLSNLLLVRAGARSKEFAVRSALGAGWGRLALQLLTESLVLAGGGAVFGLALAYGVTRYLAHQGSIALPLLSSIRIDGAALVWTVLIAGVTALLCGLAPVFRSSGPNLQDALKDTGQGISTGRGHDRMRSALVISEVALACVLLVGAGLLLRSFLRVLDVDLGFQPSRAASIQVDYDGQDNDVRRTTATREILRQVSSIPGIEAAGISDMLPLDRNRSWGFRAKGRAYAKEEQDQLAAFVYIVTPGYLEAMGMRLLEGRDFTWQDAPKSPNVVIINATAARRHWPGQDALGRTAVVNNTDFRIIGVIADVRESSLETDSGLEMYLPISQADPEGAHLVVRTKLAPEAMASAVMHTLRANNPSQPAAEFRPIQRLVDHSVSPRRFLVMLVASFAVLGLILASLGIYGVISYSVSRQTQEIGIRMALGAQANAVQFAVLGKTLRLALTGIALGAIASYAVAKGLASLLFGTEPTDPVTFAAMIGLLVAVALLAGYIPARRASRIDPLLALRGN